MKAKQAQRYINAYKRLRTQISNKVLSKEFQERISNLEKPERDKAVELYWKRKKQEITVLESKLEGHI